VRKNKIIYQYIFFKYNKLKALLRCAKYATNGVDLLSALDSKVYGDNAFRAFEHRFSMLLRSRDIGKLKRFNFGERIISKGDKVCIYILWVIG
jgi:hypothetical protein